MATDLKDENEKLQGENDLLSKRLEMRDGELLECRRKLRELETLQATAVSEYPAEGLHTVQGIPVEGGQSLEAVEAVEAVGKMGGFQVTQGWTQIIGGSAYSGSLARGESGSRRQPTGYLNRKKEIQRMGLIGWSERNSVNDCAWWPRDQTRDPTEMLINTPVESHTDTYISPGIDFRKLVDVSRERGFKLVFEHPDDIEAARSFELDFVEREESAVDVQPTSLPVERVKGKKKKKKSDSSKKGGLQVTEGWIQIIGASPVCPTHEDPKARKKSRHKHLSLRTDKIDYASKCAEMARRRIIGWKEINEQRTQLFGEVGWWSEGGWQPIRYSDPTEMLEETYKDSRSNTYISPGIDFRTLVDVSKERRFKLVFEHPDDIHAARFFELDFEERAEQGGGSRKKRSKRKRSKRTRRKRSKRRTKRKRTKRKRSKRKRSKRRRTNRRRSMRRF